MRLGSTMAAALLILLGTAAALGARASTLLDDLDTAVEDSLAFEVNQTTPNPKTIKLYTGTRKKLDKDTTSAAADIKLLKKVVSPLTKKVPENTAIQDAIAAAIAAADEGTQQVIDAAQSLVDAAEDGKKTKKAQKSVDAAQKSLDKARAKTKPKSQVSGLFKSRKKADKALGLAQRLPEAPSSGGADALVVADDDTGRIRFHVVAFPAGTSTIIDTGPGDISIEDPVPSASPDASRVCFEQGSNLLFANTTAISPLPVPTTTAPTADWEYTSWSPDSSLCAASGGSPDTLVVLDRDGNVEHTFGDNVLRGTPEDETLIWSHDSCYLAWRTDKTADGAKELNVLNVKTGVVTVVSDTDGTTSGLRYAAWSPTTNEIAYVADEDPNTRDVQLITVAPDGTGKRTLSAAGEDVEEFGLERSFHWSPDGTFLVYRSDVTAGEAVSTALADGTRHRELVVGSSVMQFGPSPTSDRVAHIVDGDLAICDPDASNGIDVSAGCNDFKWHGSESVLAYRVGSGGSSGNTLHVTDSAASVKQQASPAQGTLENTGENYQWADIGPGVALLFESDAGQFARPAVYFSRFALRNDLQPSISKSADLSRGAEVRQIKSFVYARSATRIDSTEVFLAYDSTTDEWTLCNLDRTVFLDLDDGDPVSDDFSNPQYWELTPEQALVLIIQVVEDERTQ